MEPETALVTGASSGIGRELARLLAADKIDLVLVARRREKLEQLASELRDEHGVRVHVRPHDLAQPAAPHDIHQQLSAEGIAVDILINNAGFGAGGLFAKLPLQEQLNMLQVNLVALTHLTRLFLPSMITRERGGVLNVGSTAAFQPGPEMAIYFATKAYVLSFSEALAEEMRGTNIHVTCLCPGATDTGFQAEARIDRTLLFRLGTLDARHVARAGYRALRRGRSLVVPGLANWMLTFGNRFVPRSWSRKIAWRLVSRR